MYIELRSDGPHSDDYTTEVARACAEFVRVLNYATRLGAGLSTPQTVYTLSGALNGAAFSLPQMLDQVSGFLAREVAVGRIACDDGSDPNRAVEHARRNLRMAAESANALGTALAEVQKATSRMYVPEGDLP